LSFKEFINHVMLKKTCFLKNKGKPKTCEAPPTQAFLGYILGLIFNIAIKKAIKGSSFEDFFNSSFNLEKKLTIFNFNPFLINLFQKNS
jgi:hypothetical protein